MKKQKIIQVGKQRYNLPQLAKSVRYLLGFGLVGGSGNGEKGDMCVEQVVRYSEMKQIGITPEETEEEVSDQPKCVGRAVRDLKVTLNDWGDGNGWRSNKARAEGMRQVAIAQLGSVQINQRHFTKVFCRLVVERVPLVVPDKA